MMSSSGFRTKPDRKRSETASLLVGLPACVVDLSSGVLAEEIWHQISWMLNLVLTYELLYIGYHVYRYYNVGIWYQDS